MPVGLGKSWRRPGPTSRWCVNGGGLRRGLTEERLPTDCRQRVEARRTSASEPGKEPFHGWIAEARVSTFEPGAFDRATDFLIDVAKAKLIKAAEKEKRAGFIRSLGRTKGIRAVKTFDAMAYEGDWLLKALKTASSVQILPGDELQSAQILLTNVLIGREFLVTDGNIGCPSFRRTDENLEFVRAIKPEARICLNGRWCDIGGFTGAPDQAFITPAWYPLLSSIPNSFQIAGMTIGPCVKPCHWEPKCHAPVDIAWPANGRRVPFHFAPPAGDDSLRGVTVELHYEVYEGLPVMMKTCTLQNESGKELVVTKFEGEHLAVQLGNSVWMHEIGFEILQALEHPGSFNYADCFPENIQAMKGICDDARKNDIRVGAYQLMMASQGGWSAENNGMGYREAPDNIDVGLQTVILRQYIFDATWHKTAGMGWINLNTEVLPGGWRRISRNTSGTSSACFRRERKSGCGVTGSTMVRNRRRCC